MASGGSSSYYYYNHHHEEQQEGQWEMEDISIGGAAAAIKKASQKLKAWLQAHLLASVQSYFGHVTREMISSPGFDGKVNVFCNAVLDEASNDIPELRAVLYIPGVRHKMLLLIKSQVKQTFVLLLMASGSSHDDAQAFVNTYVSDNI